jgi:hypothetical protein
VRSVELLFPGTGSVLFEDTVAVAEIRPGWFTVTVTLGVAPAPGRIARGIEQVTTR